jgi:hypothetical protein
MGAMLTLLRQVGVRAACISHVAWLSLYADHQTFLPCTYFP